MLHKGLDFQTVRILCKGCGWCRNIAHSGCSDGKRALVKISRSTDPTHVLQAHVIEVSESRSLDEVLKENPEHRDLEVEAHSMGLVAMEKTFLPLLSGQACPRCKNVGKLELSQIKYGGKHVRY